MKSSPATAPASLPATARRLAVGRCYACTGLPREAGASTASVFPISREPATGRAIYPLLRFARVLLLPIGLAVGSGHAPDAAAQSIAGGSCLDLQVGPWTPPPAIAGDTVILALPPRIHLDTIPAPFRMSPGDLPVRPAPGAPPSLHEFSSWRWIPGDTLMMSWSTGFSGVSMKLAGSEGSLSGHAISFWDNITDDPVPEADVRAMPVSCTAEVPAGWGEYRRFPRTVRLVSGQDLTVGAPIPDEFVNRGSGRSLIIRDELAGIFRGASEVRIGLGPDGRIEGIDIVFPPETGFDLLLERFSSAWGPPTGGPYERFAVRDAFWGGRDSRIHLGERLQTDGGITLLVSL